MSQVSQTKINQIISNNHIKTFHSVNKQSELMNLIVSLQSSYNKNTNQHCQETINAGSKCVSNLARYNYSETRIVISLITWITAIY